MQWRQNRNTSDTAAYFSPADELTEQTLSFRACFSMEQCYLFLSAGFLSEFPSFSLSVRTQLCSAVFLNGESELLRAPGIMGLREREFSTVELEELVASLSLSPSPSLSSVRTSLLPQNRKLIDLGESVKILKHCHRTPPRRKHKDDSLYYHMDIATLHM